MKLITIVGARPQFVKAAVVSRAIAQFNDENPTTPMREVIVHSGQHYDANMSEVFFSEMRIPKPDYYLGVGGGSHGAMTGRMLEKIEEVIVTEKPDAVLVYGDTNSTLAGTLAAVKLHVPIAHVEAGLRSFNMNMPEEVNRILTDRVSRWLFCPTDTAVQNLNKEGFVQASPKNSVQVSKVGDVMYDAVLYYSKLAKPSIETSALLDQYQNGFYLATLHRAENTDDPVRLENIMNALDSISGQVPVVMPLHPRTRKLLNCYELNAKSVSFIEPVGYFDMIILLSNCRGVFTDSGGLQKEAYFFSKPCVTLREETEWVELVEHGFNILTGADYNKIIEAESNLADISFNITGEKLYGNGDAGKKIVEILAKSLL